MRSGPTSRWSATTNTTSARKRRPGILPPPHSRGWARMWSLPMESRREGLVESHLIERGGFKVGFFGLVTPETEILSSPGSEIAFAPVIETARRAVEDLKAQGAELIVALTHQFISDDRHLAADVEGHRPHPGGTRSRSHRDCRGGHDDPQVEPQCPLPGSCGSPRRARRKDVALGAAGMAPHEHRRHRAASGDPGPRRRTHRHARRGS